jgi:hypothetical protein
MPQYNGVWTLEAAAQAQSNQQWVTDPNFKNTILLLQADNSANTANNSIFLDASVNSIPISRAGNTTQGSFTPFSESVGRWGMYVGSAGYQRWDTNTNYSGTNLTVECWAYATATTSAYTSLVSSNLGTGNYNQYFNLSINNTNQLACNAYGTGNIVATNPSQFPLNQWVHCAFTLTTGGVLSLYQNGILVASASSASIASIATGIQVGGTVQTSGGGYTAYFNGYISNARIVTSLVYSGSSFNVPTSPLTPIANTNLLVCGSNRAVDLSSNGYSIGINTVSATSVTFSPFAPQYQWTAPVIGGSGYFDGSGDNLQSAGSTALSIGTGDFTFECWAYLLSTASDPGIMQISGGLFGTNQPTYSNSIGILIVSGAWTFINNGSYTSSGVTAITRQWTHLAVSRSGTTHRFFINGVQAGSVSDSTNYTTQYFAVGCAYGTNYPSNTYISNIRFVKGTAVYTGAFTPPTAPLSASGAASASAYPSTANVSTTFVSTDTQALLNFTNAGIYDSAMGNVFETSGNAQISNSILKYGSGSMYFDGTTDFLYNNNWLGINANEDFTAEVWIYLTAAQANYRMMLADSNGNNSRYWTLNASGMEAQFGNTLSVSTSSVITYTFAQNTWYHLALVRSNNVVSMYVNGVSQTVTYPNQSTAFLNQGSALYIGKWNGASSTYEYFGYMDDLRITRGVARYYQNFIPPQVALPRQ